MLYSQSTEITKFSMLILYLRRILKVSDSPYRDYVDKVIRDTHDLAVGKKDVYNIDRDSFRVVMYLKSKDKNYYKGIDTTNIQIDQYTKTLKILEDQPHLIEI